MTSASDRYQEKSDKKEHTMRNSSTPPLLRLEDICVKFGFVEALKSVNYSGAGTIEFLVDKNHKMWTITDGGYEGSPWR